MNLNELNTAERLALALIAIAPYDELNDAHSEVAVKLTHELLAHASKSGTTLDADYGEKIFETVKAKVHPTQESSAHEAIAMLEVDSSPEDYAEAFLTRIFVHHFMKWHEVVAHDA